MPVDQPGQLVEVGLLEEDLRALDVGDRHRQSVRQIIELFGLGALQSTVGGCHQGARYGCRPRQPEGRSERYLRRPVAHPAIAVFVAETVVGNLQQADGLFHQLPVLELVFRQRLLVRVQAQQQGDFHGLHPSGEEDLANDRIQVRGRENQAVDVGDGLAGFQ